MEAAVKEGQAFQRVVVSREEALSMFTENKFKVGRQAERGGRSGWPTRLACRSRWSGMAPAGTLAAERAPKPGAERQHTPAMRPPCHAPRQVEIIKGLPDDATISLYRCGPMVDLCHGPHLPNTNLIKVWAALGACQPVGQAAYV